MREIIRNPVMIMFTAICIIIGISIAIMKGCTHKVTYEGVVISHTTTSDRHGHIEYYTVAKFNDGYVRSLRGLNYYVQPIGETIYYTTREFN